MKSFAVTSISCSAAYASIVGMCLSGITPPVPPDAFGRIQFETRVRCARVIFETFSGPPNFLMIDVAGSSMGIKSSDIRYAVKPIRSEIGYGAIDFQSLRLGMLRLWLKEALDSSKISQSELSRRLTAKLGRSIDKAAVNKMLKPAGRKIAADELLAIAEITAFPPPEPTDGPPATVPLVGMVGAGSHTSLFGLGQDPHERVEAPDGSTEATVAVEIRGTSLGALFDRWLIFYDDVRNPPDDSLMRKLCVLGLRDGETILVKKISPGSRPGRYTLTSNADEPILDADVAWAAKVKAMVPR